MHPLVQLLTSLGHLVGGGGAPAGPANPGLVNAINNATGFQPPQAPHPAPQPLVNNINRMTGMTPGAVPLQATKTFVEGPMFPPGFFQHPQQFLPLPHMQQLSPIPVRPGGHALPTLNPIPQMPYQLPAQPITAPGQPMFQQGEQPHPNLNSIMFQPPQGTKSVVPNYLEDLYRKLGGQ